MKLMTLTAALAVTLAFAQTAHAREHHYLRAAYHRHGVYQEARRHLVAHRYSTRNGENYSSSWSDQSYPSQFSYQHSAVDAFAWSSHTAYRSRYDATYRGEYAATYRGRVGATYHGGGGAGPRPRAWCGWEMRQLVGGDPGPEYNLARNWARWGHAGPAGVGAVVVWAHHVGKIVGQEGGQWIIQSGNDGNRVRTRPLSIGHAIAIRWG